MTIVRFIAVGAVNSAVALVVFAALQALFGDYRIAAIIAVPICVLFSHATMGRLVFANRRFGTLLPFVILYAALGVANALIIEAVVRLGHSSLLGQLTALPFIAVLSYLANKNIVFRQAR